MMLSTGNSSFSPVSVERSAVEASGTALLPDGRYPELPNASRPLRCQPALVLALPGYQLIIPGLKRVFLLCTNVLSMSARLHNRQEKLTICFNHYQTTIKVPQGSGEQGKMDETGCKIICGAPTTLAFKGQMIMIKLPFDMSSFIYILRTHPFTLTRSAIPYLSVQLLQLSPSMFCFFLPSFSCKSTVSLLCRLQRAKAPKLRTLLCFLF